MLNAYHVSVKNNNLYFFFQFLWKIFLLHDESSYIAMIRVW